MSGLSQLMTGADCGPSNPLQGLTKNFDRDRSLTQDATSSRAGPSRGGFRTVVQNRQMHDQAAAFFSPQHHAPSPAPAPMQAISPPPFLQQQQAWSMDSLARALPQAQAPGQQAGGWAQDFARSSPAPPAAQMMSSRAMGKQPAASNTAWAQDFGRAFASAQQAQPPPATMVQQGPIMGGPMMQQMGGVGEMGPWFAGQMQGPLYGSMMQEPILPPPTVAPPLPAEAQTVHPAPPSQQVEPQPERTVQRDAILEADDLAATASLLLESVREETNPKFKNSAFMSLMHQFKDRTATVEGNEIVTVEPGSAAAQGQRQSEEKEKEREGETSSTSTSAASLSSAWARGEDVLGNRASSASARAATPPSAAQSSQLPADEAWQADPGVSAALSGMDPTWAQWSDLMPQTSSSSALGLGQSSDMVEETLQIGQEDWHEYRTQMGAGTSKEGRSVHFEPESSFKAQEREWNTLLEQWDSFEAENMDVRPTEAYRFQEDNPYTRGQGMTRHHAMHSLSDWASLAAESVLEKEAAVQRDPTSAAAWYELGVRQQENEREQKAIQALRRAVELDPSYIDAWLALAVSLVNEGDRRQAYDAIETWIERNPRYANTRKPRSTVPSNTQTMAQRQELLMNQLITMALAVPEGGIDADVQIALGVLFNINEDYAKAIDCFHSALNVRQEDWQLYNRIGASYANSGDPEKALDYYRHALSLNPGYIRARYNLGIAEIGLKHYTEAAQHILDALVLQESEASTYRDEDAQIRAAKGVTNSALWFGLRNASAKMRRPDLVTLCDQQDLEAYRAFFAPLPSQIQETGAI